MDLKARALVAVLATLMLMTTIAGCIEPDPDLEEVRSSESEMVLRAAPGTHLVVRGVNGAIHVSGWDGDDISVRVGKVSYSGASSLDRVEVRVTEAPGLVLLEERRDGGARGVALSMNIKVPWDVVVEEVSTMSGAIHLQGLSSDMTVSTQNGAIDLVDLRGVVEATTHNGAVAARVSSLDGDMTLSSGNGAITVHLEPSMDADLTATAGNGWVSVHDLPVKTSYESNKRLDGQLGRGGHLIRCEAGNGVVELFPL